MAKKKKVVQAKDKEIAVEVQCPQCGLEREEGEPEYECRQCGCVGFDCCVPGNNAICEDCEIYNENEEEEDDE